MKIVECHGNPLARGEQTGEALREEIAQNLAVLKRPNREQWRQRLPIILDTLQRHLPDIAAEMEGLAAGAGVPVEDIWAMNFKLWDNALDGDGCTNLVFRDGPDGPIWGKNNDGDCAAPERATCLRVVRPDHGLPQAVFVRAGWVAAADGMNAAGLTVGHSSVGSVFQQSDRHPYFRMWDYAARFECRTVGEYVCRMTRVPLHDKGYSLVCVDAAGDCLAIEAPCPLVQVRRPEHDTGVFCVNCYHLPALREADRRTPADKADALSRKVHLRTVLEGPGPCDREQMIAVLRNHDGQAICRHGVQPKEHSTNFSAIGLVAERRLLYTSGQPCRNDYRELQL
jgi:isopenicillin-N N-acyltransferase-like protein